VDFTKKIEKLKNDKKKLKDLLKKVCRKKKILKNEIKMLKEKKDKSSENNNFQTSNNLAIKIEFEQQYKDLKKTLKEKDKKILELESSLKEKLEKVQSSETKNENKIKNMKKQINIFWANNEKLKKENKSLENQKKL